MPPDTIILAAPWIPPERVAEPQQQFAEALRLNPEHAGAHLGLGITLREQGREAEALAQFAEAARLNPKLLEARLYLGIALLKQQKSCEARRQFEAVLQIDPNNARASPKCSFLGAAQF